VDGPPEDVLGKTVIPPGRHPSRSLASGRRDPRGKRSRRRSQAFDRKDIVESGWGLKEMRTSDLSLEDVFVQLVNEEGKD